MAVFSSTQKTAACWGGSRYNPMMSAVFVSKSGSLLALYRSKRCGCSRACARMRCTLDLLTPISAANLGTDQCVLPSVCAAVLRLLLHLPAYLGLHRRC